MKIESETFMSIPRRVEAVHYTQEVIKQIFHPTFGRIRKGVLPEWVEAAVVTDRDSRDPDYPLVVIFSNDHSIAFKSPVFESPYDMLMRFAPSHWLEPGEWLIRDKTTGNIYSMSNEEFHKTFRVLNEEVD